MELDFTEDARQWREEFTEFERQAALWNYCLFFWGEDAVADNLSPYIDAAPREEQKYFLATQQVDEARHAVFFKRFMHEVCGIGDGSMASGLKAIKPQLTPGFRKIFDRLDTMADELRADRSRAKLAAAVTLYHIVIEAALAQPGQHFICSYLEEREQLPAFREGMANIAADEQRHIGFGVKLLSDLKREDPVGVPKAVAGLLRDVTRYTAQVLMPPGWDERYITVLRLHLRQGRRGGRGLDDDEAALRGPAPRDAAGPVDPAARADAARNLPARARARAKPASSACAKGPHGGTPRRSRCCSTRSAARSTPTTGCAVRRPSSGSSPTPTSRPGTSRSTTAPAPSRRARRPGRPAPAHLLPGLGGHRRRAPGPARAVATRRLRPRGNPLALKKIAKVFPRA